MAPISGLCGSRKSIDTFHVIFKDFIINLLLENHVKLNSSLFVAILSLSISASAVATTGDRHAINQELNRIFSAYPQTKGFIYGTYKGQVCNFGFSLAVQDQPGIPAGFHATMGTDKESFGNIDFLEQDSAKYYILKSASMTDTDIKGMYRSYTTDGMVWYYGLASFRVHHIDSNSVSVSIASYDSFITYPIFTGPASTCIFKK
jgi:hypothetical protein